MSGGGYIFTGEYEADVMHNSAGINPSMLRSGQRKPEKNVLCLFPAHMHPQYNRLDAVNPKCYGDSAYPGAPDSEYDREKLFSERHFLGCHRNNGVQLRIVRIDNMFGAEGTWKYGTKEAPAAICRIVTEAPDGGEIEIVGNGKQTRSFPYVDECAEAVRRFVDSDFTGPVNIGTEEMVAMKRIVGRKMRIAGKKLNIKYISGV